MLYESIRTPPLVLVGRQTRWTWTSSAKKKQTQNSLQRFFSRKIQSNIYNDIMVFVVFSFSGCLITPICQSRYLEENTWRKISFVFFRVQNVVRFAGVAELLWECQGDGFPKTKSKLIHSRMGALWAAMQTIDVRMMLDGYGWITFLIFPLILMLHDAAIWCCHWA